MKFLHNTIFWLNIFIKLWFEIFKYNLGINVDVYFWLKTYLYDHINYNEKTYVNLLLPQYRLTMLIAISG